MKIRRLKPTSVEIQEENIIANLHFIYKGELSKLVLEYANQKELEKVQYGDYTCFKITENCVLCVNEQQELYALCIQDSEISVTEEIVELIKYVLSEERLSPECFGDEIVSNTTFYYKIFEIVENTSCLKIPALQSGNRYVHVYFCPYCNKPWILNVHDLDTFEEKIILNETFLKAAVKVAELAGLNVRNVYDIVQYTHNFTSEFGKFLVTVLDVPDAMFIATVQHHGKDRAHKYTINIPPDVQERLVLGPGTKLEVKIKVLR